MRFFDNTLRAVDDDVFKLDNDFDFLIHDTFVEILHPAGFVYITDLEEQVFRSIVETTRQIGIALPFVDLVTINDYVVTKKSKRAAKLLVSINSRDDLSATNRDKLFNKCQSLGLVVVTDGNNKLAADERHIIDFLEVLDRRYYDYDLTDTNPEIYIASSRKIKTR